jgi:membrane-associated phospholipid phosphatase
MIDPMANKFLSLARTVVLRVGVYAALLESKVAFYHLRAIADDTGMPTQRAALPAIDRVFGLGVTPGERLQSLLFTGHVTPFDWFWVIVYESWLFVPTLVTIYVLVFHWDEILSYAPVRLAAYFISLLFFFALPAEPPWMGTDTLRITSLANGIVRVDPNQVAAFPSLHVALTVALSYWLWRKRHKIAAAIFSAYTALICFAVLYLGEHYFVDVLAGALLAVLIVRLSARTEARVGARLSALSARLSRESAEEAPAEIRPPLPEQAA